MKDKLGRCSLVGEWGFIVTLGVVSYNGEIFQDIPWDKIFYEISYLTFYME